MIEILMMLAFVLALGLSFWKLYLFMPNKPLDDDDKNEASVKELQEILYRNLREIDESDLSEAKLFQAITADSSFDKNHFWRFNENRLRQLLQTEYLYYKITDTSGEEPTPHSRIHQLRSLALRHQR